MLDELFSKLPNPVQAAIIAATFLVIFFGGKGVSNLRRSMRNGDAQSERPERPAAYASLSERLERVSNDRFDRIDRCLESFEKDTKTGFERLERALTDLGKDLTAVRSRRR